MTSLRAPLHRPPSPTPLPLAARLWLYESLPLALSVIDRHWPASSPVDSQLATEIALDTMVKGLLVSTEDINEQLSFNIWEVLLLWQDQARNGYTLGQMLREWIPHREWMVIQDVVECAQFSPSFARMGLLAQGEQAAIQANVWDRANFHVGQMLWPWHWLV